MMSYVNRYDRYVAMRPVVHPKTVMTKVEVMTLEESPSPMLTTTPSVIVVVKHTYRVYSMYRVSDQVRPVEVVESIDGAGESTVVVNLVRVRSSSVYDSVYHNNSNNRLDHSYRSLNHKSSMAYHSMSSVP